MTHTDRLLYLRSLADGSLVSLGFERFRREWAALTAGMNAEERREALGVVLWVMLQLDEAEPCTRSPIQHHREPSSRPDEAPRSESQKPPQWRGIAPPE